LVKLFLHLLHALLVLAFHASRPGSEAFLSLQGESDQQKTRDGTP